MNQVKADKNSQLNAKWPIKNYNAGAVDVALSIEIS